MSNLSSVFQNKYTEFADDLLSSFPELTTEINAAKALGPEDRFSRFQAEVLPHASPNRDGKARPEIVLPGVAITEALWAEISESSRTAIHEYLTLLSICCLFEANGGKDMSDMFGGENGSKFMDEFLSGWKNKMAGVDFKTLTEKMAGIFGIGKDGLPKLPEKFLKGHLARLAEELVRDFNPEDFGLDAATIHACEADPSKAFELLMQIYTTNPGIITGTIGKIGKRLQAKIASGEIRPQEIAAEAEELMKSFSDNPAFVEMMESFRSMFGMEDMGIARQAGREGSARLAAVKERLRKKAAAKQAAASSSAAAAPTAEQISAADAMAAALIAEGNTISAPGRKGKKK
jgi:hypothetical protein